MRLTQNGSPGSPNRIKIIKQVGILKGQNDSFKSPRRNEGSLDYSNDTLTKIVARK